METKCRTSHDGVTSGLFFAAIRKEIHVANTTSDTVFATCVDDVNKESIAGVESDVIVMSMEPHGRWIKT